VKDGEHDISKINNAIKRTMEHILAKIGEWDIGIEKSLPCINDFHLFNPKNFSMGFVNGGLPGAVAQSKNPTFGQLKITLLAGGSKTTQYGGYF